MSERMPVLTAALSVALSARCKQLTAYAVEDMRIKAEELLPAGDSLRSAIIAFATAYELERHDPKAIEAHGVALQKALDAALARPLAEDEPRYERVVAYQVPVAPVEAAAGAMRADVTRTEHHPWMDRRDIND